jgi:hypothetical protein
MLKIFYWEVIMQQPIIYRLKLNPIFTAFQPKVKASLGKVGADKVWSNIISKYNTFTGQAVTTDLNEYVTTETINGVFKMVAEKESGIRNTPP